jgi:hypothetical protein
MDCVFSCFAMPNKRENLVIAHPLAVKAIIAKDKILATIFFCSILRPKFPIWQFINPQFFNKLPSKANIMRSITWEAIT